MAERASCIGSGHDAGSRRPLAPLRVLDLTDDHSAAIATMLLADLGAEVITAEPIGGGMLRDRGLRRAWDRGKRSIEVDVDADNDQALIAALARDADVVIAPDRLDHDRLSGDVLRCANPALVHVVVSAFGALPGFEPGVPRAPLVAARVGLMGQQAGAREGPKYLGHPGIEQATAYLIVISALAALRARSITGRGQDVDVSLMDGVLALLTMSWSSDRGGASVGTGGKIDLGRRRLLLDSFECSDGKLIMVHTGASGGFARALTLLGLDTEIPVDAGPVEMASELTEAEHATLRARLPAIFATRPRDDWLRLFWKNELAALPLQDLGAVFDDDQVRHNRLVQTIDDPELGPIEVVAPPLRIDGQPTLLTCPAPQLDADGAAIRASGWEGPRGPLPADPRPLTHALDGVRIVDFGAYFAGPFASRLLSDLGAEVIKVEPLHGDPMRPLLDMFEAASRGKRSLAIDLKAAPAADVLAPLATTADIVCHNLRPGAAERAGIGYERLCELKQDLVYCHAPGYGSTGPKSKIQSFAPLHSGFVGIWAEAAGKGNRPVRAFGNEDHYNGLLGACAMLVGLIQRDRTGRSVHIESPQLHSSLFATSHVIRRRGEVIQTLPRLDHGQYGRGPLDRIYQCATGWLAIVCHTDDEARRLATVLGLSDIDRVKDVAGTLAELISPRMAARTAVEWCADLVRGGVPAEVVREESWEPVVFGNEALVSASVVADSEHPTWGPVRTIAHFFHLAEAPGARRGRAPLIGEHSTEILSELGFSRQIIGQWRSDGVVRDGGLVRRPSGESALADPARASR